MEAGDPTTLSRRASFRQPQSCQMGARPFCSQRACSVHRRMGARILQFHSCRWVFVALSLFADKISRDTKREDATDKWWEFYVSETRSEKRNCDSKELLCRVVRLFTADPCLHWPRLTWPDHTKCDKQTPWLVNGLRLLCNCSRFSVRQPAIICRNIFLSADNRSLAWCLMIRVIRALII